MVHHIRCVYIGLDWMVVLVTLTSIHVHSTNRMSWATTCTACIRDDDVIIIFIYDVVTTKTGTNREKNWENKKAKTNRKINDLQLQDHSHHFLFQTLIKALIFIIFFFFSIYLFLIFWLIWLISVEKCISLC